MRNMFYNFAQRFFFDTTPKLIEFRYIQTIY